MTNSSAIINPKPIIRWAGSKRKQLPYLRSYIPKLVHTYIEPFVGSGQLFLEVRAENYLINDINTELINFYKCLREDHFLLYEKYISLPKTKEDYYKIRSLHPPSKDRFFDAARFLFLNENCFNGLYRVNLKGEFNVPYSKIANPSVKNIESFRALSNILSKTTILNLDFEKALIDHYAEDTFVYIDPPYAVNNGKIFTQYDTKTFGTEDLLRLDLMLNKLDICGAKFLLSYAKSDEIEFISKKWNSIEIPAYRSMSGFKKGRSYQVEKLIMNY